MSLPFDRVFQGDIVTTTEILRDGWIAVRGQTIAGIGQKVPPPALECAVADTLQLVDDVLLSTKA